MQLLKIDWKLLLNEIDRRLRILWCFSLKFIYCNVFSEIYPLFKNFMTFIFTEISVKLKLTA